MMRINNRKFNIRLTKNKEVKKIIFFAFEGNKTEHIYFSKLLKKSSLDNISPVYFYREKNDGNSNPLKITKEIHDNIINNNKFNITYELFTNIVIDYCKDNNYKILDEKIKSLVQKYISKKDLKYNDGFNNEYLEDLLDKVNTLISEEFLSNLIIKKEFMEIINKYSTYDQEIDEIYIICDRDKHSFNDEQYDDVLQICKENKYNLIVTTPCIEFWFLLHFTDCKEFDKTELFNNEKIKSNNNYVFSLLKDKDISYNKNNFNAEKYVLNTKIAINNASNYTNNLLELKTSIGTCIPLIIDKLKINI